MRLSRLEAAFKLLAFQTPGFSNSIDTQDRSPYTPQVKQELRVIRSETKFCGR